MVVTLSCGFRFIPTDEELVLDYLQPKVLGRKLGSNIIMDFNVYESEPWYLPKVDVSISGGISELYFFVQNKKKSINGSRVERILTKPVDEGGWWRASATEKKILGSEGRVIALMRTLVFKKYKKGANKSSKDGLKTNWIMHEYRLPSYDNYGQGNKLPEWVLCQIKDNGKTIMSYSDDPQIHQAESLERPRTITIEDDHPYPQEEQSLKRQRLTISPKEEDTIATKMIMTTAPPTQDRTSCKHELIQLQPNPHGCTVPITTEQMVNDEFYCLDDFMAKYGSSSVDEFKQREVEQNASHHVEFEKADHNYATENAESASSRMENISWDSCSDWLSNTCELAAITAQESQNAVEPAWNKMENTITAEMIMTTVHPTRDRTSCEGELVDLQSNPDRCTVPITTQHKTNDESAQSANSNMEITSWDSFSDWLTKEIIELSHPDELSNTQETGLVAINTAEMQNATEPAPAWNDMEDRSMATPFACRLSEQLLATQELSNISFREDYPFLLSNPNAPLISKLDTPVSLLGNGRNCHIKGCDLTCIRCELGAACCIVLGAAAIVGVILLCILFYYWSSQLF